MRSWKLIIPALSLVLILFSWCGPHRRIEEVARTVEAEEAGKGPKVQPAGAKEEKSYKIDVSRYKILRGHTDGVEGVRFSPDGMYVASASMDATARIWSIDGALRAVLRGHRGPVRAVDFNPDGSLVATVSDDRTLRLWNSRGRMIRTVPGHGNWVIAVAFSPDGEVVATGADDGQLRLWNLRGELLWSASAGGRITSISFSPDGRQVAAASYNYCVYIHDISGAFLRRLDGHNGNVFCVSYRGDGTALVTAACDPALRLWDAEGNPAGILSDPNYFTINDGRARCFQSAFFSPDGGIIVSANFENRIRFWSAAGKTIHEVQAHPETSRWHLTRMVMSREWNRMAAAVDNNVVLWNVGIKIRKPADS